MSAAFGSGSGSGSDSGFLNDSNVTMFNCRASELSSSNVTNVTFWQIRTGLEEGAIVVGVLVTLMFCVSLIWNLFILITFIVKRELLKEPANILLFNVAINDLIVALTTMVFTFVTAYAQEFVFGSDDVTRCALCNMSGFCLIFVILLNLHLLMGLSIDRFIHLTWPLRYKRLMNRWKTGIMLVIIYIVCIILSILPLIGFGEIEFNGRLGSCTPRFTPPRNLLYQALVSVEALIPIIILAGTNTWTFRLVRKFFKRNYRRRSTYKRKDRDVASEETQKHQKQQKQLVKVFGAFFVANICTYTPTMLTIFFALVLVDRIPGEVYVLGFISFLMNPVVHPIIESCFIKELRYQVNRAKKGVRRVSTSIYRQTTQLFSNKSLEEANRKIEEGGSPPKSKRTIRFLDGRTLDTSVATEMEDVTVNSRSVTPEPDATTTVRGVTSHKVNGTNPETGNNLTPPPTTSAAAASTDSPKPMLKNTRTRSVTFDSSNHVFLEAKPRSGNSGSDISLGSPQKLESCLRKPGGGGGEKTRPSSSPATQHGNAVSVSVELDVDGRGDVEGVRTGDSVELVEASESTL